MAITKQDVWRIADEIDATGNRPTLAAVRKMLGGGSFTTISDAMSEWHAKRAVEKAPRIDPAPERVQGAASEFAQLVWAAAAELANGRMQSERDALEAARKQFEEEQAEAAAFADQLNGDLEAANRRIGELEQELERVKKEGALALDQVTGSRDAERSRAERAEATADERDKHIASLKGELEKVRSDKEQEIARLAGLLTSKKPEKGKEE